MLNDKILLAYGAGGSETNELISSIFRENFANPCLTADDAAVLPAPAGKMAMTTDGFIVSPFEFPGGNIGKLSICGTVNDLACMGAKPLYLTCSFVIEEGFLTAKLREIAESMAQTAKEAGVKIVAGDTKVTGAGQADKIFITTTGVGEIAPGIELSGTKTQAGDAVILTGDPGRHACAILLARDSYHMTADVKSDCAPLWETVKTLLDSGCRIHTIRDATRGGVGTVLYEIAHQSGVGIRLDAAAIPSDPAVKGLCGMLGLEPLYLACEGRLVIFAPQEEADKIITLLRRGKYSSNAAVIGTVSKEMAEEVTVRTEIGAETRLPIPGGELLPRIC